MRPDHAFDAGLQVAAANRRYVDQQLRNARLRHDPSRHGVRQLAQFDIGAGRRQHRAQPVYQCRDAAGCQRMKAFDRLRIQVGAMRRVVHGGDELACFRADFGAFVRIAPQGFQCLDQRGVGEFVGQLPCGSWRQVRHAAVRVHDGGQAVVHAIEHRARGFAAAQAAQLHADVRRAQIKLVLARLGPAGNTDAAARAAGVNAFLQRRAVVAAVVFADQNQFAARVIAQRRLQPRVEQAMGQLGRRNEAETAHHETIAADAERIACGLAQAIAVGRRRCRSQVRDASQAGDGLLAIPLRSQPDRVRGMYDDPGSVLQQRQVAGIVVLRRHNAVVAVRAMAHRQGRVAVRMI